VVGLRKVNWDTMRANFFVLTPPVGPRGLSGKLDHQFLPAPEQAEFVNRLVRDFPNLTVIDVAAILRQLQSIMDQVARAVQFVFLFTLAAGVIVLHAALASAAEERRYELAVMRALGARREQLRRALLAEFAAIGGLAGLIAALAAISVGQFLARQVFRFEVAIEPLAAAARDVLWASWSPPPAGSLPPTAAERAARGAARWQCLRPAAGRRAGCDPLSWACCAERWSAGRAGVPDQTRRMRSFAMKGKTLLVLRHGKSDWRPVTRISTARWLIGVVSAARRWGLDQAPESWFRMSSSVRPAERARATTVAACKAMGLPLKTVRWDERLYAAPSRGSAGGARRMSEECPRVSCSSDTIRGSKI
jgi:hypothetical protein